MSAGTGMSEEWWPTEWEPELRQVDSATVLRIAYDALDYAFMPEKRGQIDTAKALIRARLAGCPPPESSHETV